jgi:hypothetical protein
VLDRVAPAKPVVNPSNGTEVSGSAEPGSTVTVTDQNGQVVAGCDKVVVDVNGHFVCTPVTRIPQGDQVTVVATDQAGNPSEPTQLTVGKLGIDISNPTPKVGDPVTVTGTNFNPGEQVCLTIMSNTVNVGCATADPKGSVVFSFTIPTGLTVGPHTMTLTAPTSGTVSAPFQVAVTVATGGTSIPGTSFPYGLLFAGSVMVLAGLLVGARRRAPQQEKSFSS